jgi:formylglycine-generating enzyme required for sulfatase activity
MRRLFFLAPALAAACGPVSRPGGLAVAAMHLHIDNPARFDVAVAAVDDDRRVAVARPGTAADVRLELLPGCYVVTATTPRGPVSLAAPLLPQALGRGGSLALRVPAVPAIDPEVARAFAWVPAGPALLGDTLGVGQEDERPARVAFVPAFLIGRCEVTNAEYAAFLDAVAPRWDPAWCAFDSRKCRLARGADGRWSTPAPREPVVTVSLAGARAFCDWRTAATGVRHRLPTEAEWEKAARGPGSHVFAYGNVYRRGAANQESGTLREVAASAADEWGIHDLTGNAFEWTGDPYRERPGAAPVPGFHVLRGGSFVLDGMYLRNSFRMRQRPDVRSDDIGFRVVREPGAGHEGRPP